MRKILVAVNMKVQCADGCTHEGVTMTVEDDRRIYLAADGTQLEGVQCIDECTSLLPPTTLVAVLGKCKENDK